MNMLFFFCRDTDGRMKLHGNSMFSVFAPFFFLMKMFSFAETRTLGRKFVSFGKVSAQRKLIGLLRGGGDSPNLP